MSDGIGGFGTTLSGVVVTDIVQITNLSIPGIDITSLDVSTMASTNGWKEFIAGMVDAGEIVLQLLYEGGNHAAIQGAVRAANEVWTITLPDGSTFACDGFIQNLGLEVPMDGTITQSCNIKLSGEPTFDEATA